MGDGPPGIQIFPDHFTESTSGEDSPRRETSSAMDLTTPTVLRCVLLRIIEEKINFM